MPSVLVNGFGENQVFGENPSAYGGCLAITLIDRIAANFQPNFYGIP